MNSHEFGGDSVLFYIIRDIVFLAQMFRAKRRFAPSRGGPSRKTNGGVRAGSGGLAEKKNSGNGIQVAMSLFLSTYVNKVDSKGRVSVPAQFRAALAAEQFQGVVVFRSNNHAALEGFSWSFMEEIGERLDHFDLFSDSQDDLATAMFGDSVQLPFDGDGRIILPKDLIDFAGINDSAAFVGLGKKFQIWNPAAFRKRRDEARTQVKAQGLTIPKGGRE